MTATFTQYVALIGEVETPWIERTYGRHSDTRHLDEVTAPIDFLLKRENYSGTPRSHWNEAA